MDKPKGFVPRPKRGALLLFLFFATIDGTLLYSGITNAFTWQQWIYFVLFFLLSGLCLLSAFPNNGLIRRLDTRTKRIALLLFPFFATTDVFLLHRDVVYTYTWSPSLSFALFFLLSIGCLLFAFTRLSDWVSNG